MRFSVISVASCSFNPRLHFLCCYAMQPSSLIAIRFCQNGMLLSNRDARMGRLRDGSNEELPYVVNGYKFGLARYQPPVYDIRAMNRARLIALETAC
jgi:hypothetical protein